VVLGRYVPQLSFLHILLGDEPMLVAEAQLYQRLLAMDDQEARAVADRYLSQNSLVKLYDQVMIPALTMAEQDRHKGALDKAREEFVFLSIKEMLAELSEETLKAEPASGEDPIAALEQPTAFRGRVLCLPASDEADEITGAMLAQLLEHATPVYPVLSFPLDPSLQHVGVVEPTEHDLFCISALPPFAFARARNLSRQLQARFPRTRIIVGVWGFTGDTERALRRFQPLGSVKLVTSLADAIALIESAVPTAVAIA
jgi:hypothetical protein